MPSSAASSLPGSVVRALARLWTHRRGLLTGLLALTALVVFAAQTVRYNPTASIPVGFYYKRSLTDPPERGQYVLVCLTGEAARLGIRRGYVLRPTVAMDCPEGALGVQSGGGAKGTDGVQITAIAKRVLAVPGDTVRLDTTGLYIRGGQVSGPPPRTDSKGRAAWPRYGTHVMGEGEYWIGSPAHRAYDSRYVGPVARRQIVAAIRPLWTWR